MRAEPEDLEKRALFDSLFQGWGLNVVAAEYVAVGFGSHHWLAVGDTGSRHWVTVDDLTDKAYLGDSPDAAFGSLRRALDTASALRAGGLEFVVAPVPSAAGETVRRLGSRHAVAVYPYLDGRSGRFGEGLGAAWRGVLVDALARLHGTAPRVPRPVRAIDPQLSRRRALEDALGDVRREWRGGPFSEPARALLAERAAGVRRRLETFDRLAAEVRAAGRARVVTHGEPHPGNVMIDGGRLLLVDWDTAGLAPPERDVWMLDTGGGEELARYAEVSGRPVDSAALRLYRMRWPLEDMAIFVRWFRSPHRRTADTEHAWDGFARAVDPDEEDG